MKELNLKKLIRLTFLPVGCLSLLSACAPYEPVVYGSSTSVTTVETPATLFDRLDANRDGFLSRGEGGASGRAV